MNEIMNTGLSPEENEEARRLYARHHYNAKSLTGSLDLMKRADAAREIVRKALDTKKTFDEIDYHTAVFANGEITQRAALHQAQSSYNANMWEGYQFKQERLARMMTQAAIEANEDGTVIKMGSNRHHD